MGVYTGLYPKHWSSRLLQAVSLIGVSLPPFLIGILLILVFAVMPALAAVVRPRRRPSQLGWWTTNFLTWSGLKALILPSITLGLFQLTLIMRLVRSEMLEVMRTDYIKFAPRPRPHQPRHQFRPCAQEHAGAGDHRRPACSSAR